MSTFGVALGGGGASVKRMSWPNLADLIVDRRRRCAGRAGRRAAGGGVGDAGRCDLAPARLRATLRRIGRYDVETRRELASRIARSWRCRDRRA